MSNHAILNNVDHKDLRVHTGHGTDYGDDVMCTLAIPSEFRSLVADYPIFLHRDQQSGRYLPMVMFGFEEGENLYLEGEQWQASYIPLMVKRGPFLIGFQGGEPGSRNPENMVISIDMDNPRVGTEGEPLFQPFGDNSEYTEQIIGILQEIDQGQGEIDAFVDVLLEHDLIEPFSLEIKLNNGKTWRLEGFETIHEERLSQLDGEVLAELSRRGILYAAYMVLASMANIPKLIALKNRRI